MLEILAPAGGPESLTAALNTGTDAVYLGYSSFSARKNAVNFDRLQLLQAVDLCHRSGVKVYVALNTLVKDSEIAQLRQAVEAVAEAGADALIVQDFAVAAVAREIAPRLHLHASTQMTITSPSGAEFVKKQGFTRVVLARELSLAQIEKIVRSVDIETEVFVHGALCVCVSGQCYMSAVLGGRSGNRGLCAQPCRLNFSCDGQENILSLKDLSLIENLAELERIGVTSAKIEGRMKRPEYVAAAVSQCRRSLSGEAPDTGLLRDIFSRSGFTQGYWLGDMKNMQGVRTKDDVVAAPKAFAQLHELYKAPYKRFTVDFRIELAAEQPALCTAECTAAGRRLSVTVTGEIPQKAVSRALDCESVCRRMEKLGGTVFEAGAVSCKIQDGLALSAAALNDLRRCALEELSVRIAGSQCSLTQEP